MSSNVPDDCGVSSVDNGALDCLPAIHRGGFSGPAWVQCDSSLLTAVVWTRQEWHLARGDKSQYLLQEDSPGAETRRLPVPVARIVIGSRGSYGKSFAPHQGGKEEGGGGPAKKQKNKDRGEGDTERSGGSGVSSSSREPGTRTSSPTLSLKKHKLNYVLNTPSLKRPNCACPERRTRPPHPSPAPRGSLFFVQGPRLGPAPTAFPCFLVPFSPSQPLGFKEQGDLG